MKTSVIFGGAGFLGSHLADRLFQTGRKVVVVDDLSSGTLKNIASLEGAENFTFIKADICEVNSLELSAIDEIYNLASPASPPRYMANRTKTLLAGSKGVLSACELALRNNSRLVQASTSEIYGDPQVHPQHENYWGNVNPIGERSCYDEAKRFAEAMCAAMAYEKRLDVGIIRIFNTYGPRLSPLDGRVISNFISQALRNEPLSIYGDGSQTRSFCYVDDMIDGLIRMAESSHFGPINLGNPVETSVGDIARLIIEMTRSASNIEYHGLPSDDPVRRRPDVNRAREVLNWSPQVALEDGLEMTISWFRELILND
jgi:dTDP-glucose 4,6-dehydratase